MTGPLGHPPAPAAGLVGGLRAHLHLLHHAPIQRSPTSVGWFSVGPVLTGTQQLVGVSVLGRHRGVAVFLCPARHHE